MSQNNDMEIEGNSVEAAIKKALDTLRLPRNKLKITVLSEGEKGLFGMRGARPAKIKVSIITDKEKT